MFDRNPITCVLAAIAGLVFAGGAAATAVYSSAATSTFTLDLPSLPSLAPVTDIKENMPSSPLMTSGSATATIDKAIVSGADAHPISVDSKVSGTASMPPTSSSSAAALRGHLVEVERVSGGDPLSEVSMDFTFVMSWEVHLAVDAPGLESAGGGAYFAIAGFEDGIEALEVDGPNPGAIVTGSDGKLRWEFNPSYFTTMVPVDAMGSLTITGTITVFEGEVGAFSVITDSAGRADARMPVAEPGSLALLGVSLAGLGAGLRRRSLATPLR